jgi:pyruvate ferredoxin oxidoreductase gamma subunit
MLRVRFHGRGGQGVKVASRVLGTAAFLEGYYAQDFPLYGAERRGAPISAFTRIAREPIMERGVIAEPDIVLVMDETLLHDTQAMPMAGLKAGGIVFINTIHTPAEARAEYKITAHTLTLDITKISLDMLGLPVLSTLAGAVAARIVGLKEASLRDAVEKEVTEILTDRALVAKNIKAALACFQLITPVKALKTTASVQKKSPVITVPFEPAAVSSPTILATATTPLRQTGSWRVFRPTWDYEACTKCMACVARCPDGCIRVDEEGRPYLDYRNCKGCLICVEECPTKSLGKVRETLAEHDAT